MEIGLEVVWVVKRADKDRSVIRAIEALEEKRRPTAFAEEMVNCRRRPVLARLSFSDRDVRSLHEEESHKRTMTVGLIINMVVGGVVMREASA
jgi:hypothetical protein